MGKYYLKHYKVLRYTLIKKSIHTKQEDLSIPVFRFLEGFLNIKTIKYFVYANNEQNKYSFKVTIKEKRNNLKTKFILNYLKSKFSHYVCTFFMAIHIFIIINYL